MLHLIPYIFMIEIKNLSKIYDTKDDKIVALKDINLTINDGEIFGIIGLSGAGKSTLVRTMNLLEVPTSGEVLVDGKNLVSLSKKDLSEVRKSMGMIFQNFNLYDQRNVLRNVEFPLELLKVPKEERIKIAKEMIKLVSLENRESSYPSMLSGGEKQRVAIARSLTTNPKYLLCDEITSALDPDSTLSILNLLKDINKKLNVTIVVITHEMKVIEKICDRVAIINNSKIEEIGKVSDIFTHPESEIGRKLVLPESSKIDFTAKGEKIRLIFDGVNTKEAIISELILECQAPINILYADTKEFDGVIYGHMIIELPSEKILRDKIISWLDNNNQKYKKEEE